MLFRETKTGLMVAAGVVTGVALVFLSYPGGALALCRDARDMPELLARVKADAERRRVLNQKAVALNDRIAYKDRLIGELIAGRATLADVSARFHELNAAYPPCLQMIRHQYPHVGGDDERATLNVIEFVRLNDMTEDQRDEVEARLAAEFYAAFGHEVRVGEPALRSAEGSGGEPSPGEDGIGPARSPQLNPVGDRGELTLARRHEASLGGDPYATRIVGVRRLRREVRARRESFP